MVKCIFLDIDDTLFPSSSFSSLARKNAINAMIGMGLEKDPGELDSLLLDIIEKKGSNYQAHFNDLCKRLKIKDPARYIAAAIAKYHDTKTSIQPFPRVPLTLLKLKKSGYHIYVATNGNPIKQWDKIIRLGLALYFEDVFVSEEIGSEKGPEFYKKILGILKADAGDCMMVGDREDADIAPAKKAGMRTVRVLCGKYANVPSKADFVIKDISELVPILQRLKNHQI